MKAFSHIEITLLFLNAQLTSLEELVPGQQDLCIVFENVVYEI